MGRDIGNTLGWRVARQISVSIGVFAAVVIAATVGYVLCGWPAWDAFYMVIITVFGVGFGEVEPIDTITERWITIGAILAGTSATVYVVGSLIKIITEGEIQRAMSDQKKFKSIENLKQHTIVCGYGRIGQTIVREFLKSDHSFVVLDRSPERIAMAEADGCLAIEGDAGDEDILNKAHIGDAANLAAVLPDDMVNLFITLTARNMNSNLRIIARAENPATEKKLIQAGATEVILPAFSAGMHIAHRVTRPSLLRVLSDSHKYLNSDLQEIGVELDEREIPVTAVGKTVDAYLQTMGGRCIVLALAKAGGETIQSPPGKQKLEKGDRLVLLVRRETDS